MEHDPFEDSDLAEGWVGLGAAVDFVEAVLFHSMHKTKRRPYFVYHKTDKTLVNAKIIFVSESK